MIGSFSNACTKLDLNPLSEGSSATWFSNETEIRSSLDYLYNIDFWDPDPDPSPENYDNQAWWDRFTDDWLCRNSTNAITGGSMTAETPYVVEYWNTYYKCIAAANLILEKLANLKGSIPDSKLDQFTAEAKFVRAYQYSKLIFLWGDVPYYEKTLKIEEAFSLGRTSKTDILQHIYDDFNSAASKLPVSYSGTIYATKGAALALKARIALRMGDWETARDAAKACMDLNTYQLYPDFSELFYSKTKNSIEAVFSIPRSITFNITYSSVNEPTRYIRYVISRNNGGNDYVNPSWDLLCCYLCTDGLPIDESPLYNPRRPFDNRDPRCSATLVAFGSEYCDYIYQPHPDSLLATNVVTGERKGNNDSRGVTQFAAYNGMAWRKGVDKDWWDDLMTDPEHIVIRYADVLFMYAEAKIELNQIDQSVLDAINMVRARAYKVDFTQTTEYPAVTTTDQSKLRHILRTERHMEFAFEGLRYADIIRWRLAEKVLNTPNYGMIDPPEQRTKIVEPGLWFFPEVTPIDDDGVADFSSMYSQGYVKVLAVRSFNKDKNYLWPIPASEILINKNMVQNEGY